MKDKDYELGLKDLDCCQNCIYFSLGIHWDGCPKGWCYQGELKIANRAAAACDNYKRRTENMDKSIQKSAKLSWCKHKNHYEIIKEFYALNKYLISEQLKDTLLDAIECMEYNLCEKTGMAVQKHIGGYLPHELTPDIFSNEGIKVQEGEADEWERVWMSGDKRAIAQYKVDHGYTMSKEEMDILEEEKNK